MLYLSVFSLLGLTTFNVSTVFSLTFTMAVSLMLLIAVCSCKVQMTGHFSPESMESADVAQSVGRPFTMVIGGVEVFSFAMRAVSLPLRMSTNFTCGHMLVVLNGGLNTSLGPLLGGVAVMGLETGVCFMQSYVFITLSSMYWEEVWFLT